MNDTDNDLLARLGRGDYTAFEPLFLRHYDRVYRVVYGLVGSREASEDLAQETFLELHRRAAQLQPDTSLGAWLCRVALNKGYNVLRDGRRARLKLESLASMPADDPYAELLRAEDRARVRAVLSRLQERQVKILMMRYAGYSLAEMAAVLGLASGSMGTLLARAEKAFVAAYELMHPAESKRLHQERK
ncbi:MAG TPA: sigma-70 family RNA polymerase sigma factor [Chloroflexia bacterium]|nr:sigma-70 family RNA polymerase sigma factor [Chloroflexia bacterium]